jgi:hypothetical protein
MSVFVLWHSKVAPVINLSFDTVFIILICLSLDFRAPCHIFRTVANGSSIFAAFYVIISDRFSI